MIGKLWYGSWSDYEKIRQMYGMDIMVSICRYPPYRYYGSVERTGVVDFRHLGPSPQLHKERIQTNMDWTKYANLYEKEIKAWDFESQSNKEYWRIIDWVQEGKNICMLCTCRHSSPCHRFLLWTDMIKEMRSWRGGLAILNWPFPTEKVTDEIWEKYAIYLFRKEGHLDAENAITLACPHPEMSAAYERLIRKRAFGQTETGLYLRERPI
jgi:uncharacterized protein YeaO (DUF488 family)